MTLIATSTQPRARNFERAGARRMRLLARRHEREGADWKRRPSAGPRPGGRRRAGKPRPRASHRTARQAAVPGLGVAAHRPPAAHLSSVSPLACRDAAPAVAPARAARRLATPLSAAGPAAALSIVPAAGGTPRAAAMAASLPAPPPQPELRPRAVTRRPGLPIGLRGAARAGGGPARSRKAAPGGAGQAGPREAAEEASRGKEKPLLLFFSAHVRSRRSPGSPPAPPRLRRRLGSKA